MKTPITIMALLFSNFLFANTWTMVGEYKLVKNLKGEHFTNYCPTNLGIYKDEERQASLVLWSIDRKNINKQFSNINIGTQENYQPFQIGGGGARTATVTTMTTKSNGDIILLEKFSYNDPYANGDENTRIIWKNKKQQLLYKHKNIHTMPWWQYEVGSSTKENYRKPDHDIDCIYDKIANTFEKPQERMITYKVELDNSSNDPSNSNMPATVSSNFFSQEYSISGTMGLIDGDIVSLDLNFELLKDNNNENGATFKISEPYYKKSFGYIDSNYNNRLELYAFFEKLDQRVNGTYLEQFKGEKLMLALAGNCNPVNTTNKVIKCEILWSHSGVTIDPSTYIFQDKLMGRSNLKLTVIE
ncbi:MAG: hypothetical protein A2381_11140 [Bdellovibrionales bacterium RIFOXYB1_FULL_37_110]|nr:MAG: hypothetical protein A2181_01460 [Bdellovibrionales bacterium RIFOXYA1_FULL_38_20]OFZ48595.1 MAG: hypothetical protein A2417_09625 [Bdellovibrionales bacterium RIFOXYC1_FULL_37_79]OFZ58404.1 MAG: hypothetical protein A2381_11140 [Bdellovibrionales bacterium RIFOXYB1_FULL_37_110]